MSEKIEKRKQFRARRRGRIGEEHAVQVVDVLPDHKFVLDDVALEKLLMKEDIKDRSVVVISISGVFRRGKSFLLDFFIRYLRAEYSNSYRYFSDGDWLGPEDTPLEGFSWRGGSERETTGIHMWSEVFCTTLPSGEEVAIILLDTQGTFDSESTVKDCATVFALSTMVSSVQIYNLSQNIQEDDLQHLQLFTDYGRLALEDTGMKPFQKLLFLVRDWSCPYESEYGEEGGYKLLNKRLRISEKQHPELQKIRRHVKSCFIDIGCFLMPHPGLKVSTCPSFDGKLSDIDVEFKACLRDIAPMLLGPENLIIKEINGQQVKAKELLHYFKSYVSIYNGDGLPEPKTMLEATAEANNLAALAAAKEFYHSLMDEICGASKPFINLTTLDAEHSKIKAKVMDQFINKPKMGGAEFAEQYLDRLDKDLEELYKEFRQHNASKNVSSSTRTPIVMFTTSMVFYLVSGLFGFVGMNFLATSCTVMMLAAITTLATWLYVKCAGDLADLGELIDNAAVLILENIMKPLFFTFLQKGFENSLPFTGSMNIKTVGSNKND